MTLGGLKTGMCSASLDLGTITACQWQSLHSTTEDSHYGRPVGSGILGPKSRHRHSACGVGEYVYVFGGKEGTSPRKDVWRFHINNCRWEAVELQGAVLPFLQGHTSVAYKNLVLIFGGTFSDSMGDAQLWTFDTDAGYVEEVRLKPGTSQPACRRDHSAVVHNNTMYVYGGYVGSRGSNQELWAFNMDEMEWRELRALSRTQPSCRYSHSAVVADNAMWLFGGLEGLQPKADLWRYSFLLHQWKKVKALGSPPCLSGHAASVVHRHMIVVGGKCQRKAVSEVWCFSFDTSTWQQVSQLDRLLPCLSFHACVPCCLTQPTTKDSLKYTSHNPSLKSPSSCPMDMSKTCLVPSIREEKIQSSLQSIQSRREAQAKISTDSSAEEAASSSHTRNSRLTDQNVNSCNMTDNRIHVSLEEALIPPASPESASLSQEPFPKTASGYIQLKEDYVHESTPSNSACSILRVDSSTKQPSQTFLQILSPQSDSEKSVMESQESVPDLIDLSESPVLKVPSHGKAFCFGELGLLDFDHHGAFSASGPPTNNDSHLQSQHGTKDSAVLSCSSQFQVQSKWSPLTCLPQTLDFSGQPGHQQRHVIDHEVTLESVFPQTDSVTGADLQDVKMVFSDTQLGQESLHQMADKQETQKLCHKTESQEWQIMNIPSVSLTKDLQGFYAPPTSTGAQAEWSETDSSFAESETGEDVLLIHSELGGQNKMVSGAASDKKLRKMRGDGVKGERERDIKQQTVFRVREAKPDREFLLVLGGRIGELGSGLCKPMPVWKGVLL